jgi:hypothetical protein
MPTNKHHRHFIPQASPQTSAPSLTLHAKPSAAAAARTHIACAVSIVTGRYKKNEKRKKKKKEFFLVTDESQAPIG